MKASQVLQAGLNIIIDPTKHTKVFYARDENGSQCNPLDPKATCWCSAGVLDKVVTDNGLKIPVHGAKAARYLVSAANFLTLNQGSKQLSFVEFNDYKMHPEVINMWKIAINTAIQRGD